MITIIWEYRVRRGQEKKFERIYGPDGAWAKLFSTDPRYHGTQLENIDGQRIYKTMDQWDSEDSFEDFKERHAQAYATLDHLCETLTEFERRIAS